jgi:hypothetical protein
MASEHNIKTYKWITSMETSLDKKDNKSRSSLTWSSVLRGLDQYDMILNGDNVTKIKAKKLILKASKRILEKNMGSYEKALTRREGTMVRLRGIASYANHLINLVEPVLLHIDELDYARNILKEFMPRVEETARFATKLDPVMASQMLRIVYMAENLGLVFNQGLREVFEEIIQLHITSKKLDAPRLLLDLAQIRFEAGEYLTSYLLSREATRSMLEDLTRAYPQDLGPANTPSPDWIFEDYLGYLIEVGLISEQQGQAFQDLFVGEAEHLNSRWKKRDEAEKALMEIKTYLSIMDKDTTISSEWL